MTSAEVMAALHISKPTLYKLVGEGVLQPINPKPPYLKRTWRYQFRRADVERLKPSQPNPAQDSQD